MSSSLYGAGAEYALHSLLVLATRSGPVSVGDLASYQRIPERFLAKLFSRLTRAGLVQGIEGIAGGFALARPAAEIRVRDVLDAVDPGRRLFACAEIRGGCAVFGATPPDWAVSGPCRIHAFMEEAERVLRTHLATKSLADLACELACKAPAAFTEDSERWFQQRRHSRGARRTGTQPEGPAPADPA